MSDPNQPSVPPGWYPDGQGGQRWWDGSQWTEHTQPPGGTPETPSAPAAPARPAAPASPPPGDLPTQVAPNRAAGYPQQPQQPQQPQSPQQPQTPQQGAYGPPAGYGQPAQAGGQPPFGQPPFGVGSAGSSGGGNGKLFAIIGGAVAALLVLIIVAWFAFKVVLGGGSPEDVANDYLDAQADFDYQRVCELVREKDQKAALDELGADDCGDVEGAIEDDPSFDQGEFDAFKDDFELDYEIGDVTEKDKTAEVDYTATVTFQGEDNNQDGTIYLVKEDGDWRVDQSKSDSVGIF